MSLENKIIAEKSQVLGGTIKEERVFHDARQAHNSIQNITNVLSLLKYGFVTT
jgi:hypothetical protein